MKPGDKLVEDYMLIPVDPDREWHVDLIHDERKKADWEYRVKWTVCHLTRVLLDLTCMQPDGAQPEQRRLLHAEQQEECHPKGYPSASTARHRLFTCTLPRQTSPMLLSAEGSSPFLAVHCLHWRV